MTVRYNDKPQTPHHKTSSLLKCLTECSKNKDVEIVSVNAGRGAKHRLANLGLVPGTKITKTRSAVFNGPVEVSVKGSKIVLGRGLAAKVIVKCDQC
ncbi:MAG: ferrous iron transport protein A [Promethearchaeota archaeon]|nr:MAG: ferrous iron transport protein A [Candidatus Lokiarchaeota archaeon]